MTGRRTDLGPGETGYDVLMFIELATYGGLDPPKIHIHTMNGGARGKMEAAVKKIEQMVAERSSETNTSSALSIDQSRTIGPDNAVKEKANG